MAAMSDARELNLTLDLSLRVGELLLSSGAGAADVTATMQSLARQYGVRHPEIDVTFTSLSMSYQPSAEEPAFVLIRQVKQREIDYEDLTQVDHLVRDVLRGEVPLKDARNRLARIVSSGHATPRWLVSLGWGVMCAGVGLLLEGGPGVIAIAFVAAVCIDRLQLVLARRRLPSFYRQVAGGALATVIAVLAAATLDLNPSVVVTANIIMLLAGIGFMGALQDALSGFYVTGGARLTEALLSTAGIIAGVSGGLALADAFGVEVDRLDPGAVTDLGEVTVVAVGAAVCAVGFAFSSYAPRRTLLPIGVVAAIAMVISQSLGQGGFGRTTWPTALAAFFVGLVSYTVAGRLRVPPLVVVVSAVVPMLPGLSIYRGLSLLTEDGTQASGGILALMTAASVALALASGVILGEYVAQPLRREASRVEERLSGPRLVGPLRIRGPRRRGPVD